MKTEKLQPAECICILVDLSYMRTYRRFGLQYSCVLLRSAMHAMNTQKRQTGHHVQSALKMKNILEKIIIYMKESTASAA